MILISFHFSIQTSDMNNELDKSIDEVENDDSLTSREKQEEIDRLIRLYRRAAEEAAQKAYDDELSNW